MTDIRIAPTAALTATVIALGLFVTWHPTAAVWAAVVALVLAVAGLFTLAKESIDLRAEADDRERHIEALEAECTRLHVELTEAQIAGGVVLPLPRLRVVADEPTPIHDRALIEAWIEDVQAWGQDADQ